jgi:hypothetical protein
MAIQYGDRLEFLSMDTYSRIAAIAARSKRLVTVNNDGRILLRWRILKAQIGGL